mgnify:CR=1 FL=1
MQKRLISMVLALSMALSAMPLPALAQSAPPDTASAAALAEENDDVTDIFPDDWSGKPAGDPFGGGKGSWSYDKDTNTLILKKGTFCLRNYSYDSYNNCIQWNVKIEPDATLQEARIGSEYHNGYTVTNAGTISGGTFYGKVICEAGAVISGGTFKGAARVDAAGGEVTIEDGTFEEVSYTSGMTVKAAGTLTINGGTFKGKRICSVDINNCERIVINGGSFETALTDLERTTEIIINGGLFNDKLYVAGDKCTVNGGLFTTEDDPLPEGAAVNGGYFTAKSTGLVAIDAASAPVYAPVAVAMNGTVNEWSADAYSTLYVAPNTGVTLKPTCKLESIVSGDDKLSYKAKGGAVSFTVGTEAVRFNSVTVGELVIEADGFPKGTDGGVYGAKGKGWSFEPNHKHAEWHTSDTPVLTIEEGTELNLDEVENHSATVKFAIENNGTLTGTLNSTQYVYNKKTGTIKDATLNSLENRFYNDGRVKNAVLRFYYIGNGWRDPAQSVIILSSALDVSGSVANSSTYQAVLEDCYNSDDYTGNGSIDNGGTIKDGRSTLKLAVDNTDGYDGNAKYRQPTIDGGEYTFVYNKNGIYLNDPIIHVMAAKKEEDANVLPGATCYTMKYTPPENARYDAKYISGLNGTLTGIWRDNLTTLYVATIDDSISALTCDRITSVNGVAYNASVPEGKRYTSTIDLRKYNIQQTHILNLSATDEGAAALPDADPADFTFALPTNPTYDGNPKMVEVIVRENATKKYGAVTVTYKQNGKVLNGAPVEPGTYTFTVTVAATATCAGGDVTPKYNTFAIQKAALNPADFTVTEPTDLTYDGKPKEVTVTNNSTKDYGKITVFYEMSGGKVVHGAPVEPGKYYYSVVTEGSARYKSGSVADGTFTITNDVKPDPKPEPDPADFTFALPTDLTYNGNPKRVEVDVKDNATKEYGDVTVTYKQDGKVLNGAPVEPGTYTFTAVVAATATCAGGDVTPKYNTFTIQKAALNPADFTVTNPNLTYDGTPKEVTVKNTSDKDYGEITVTYKQNGEALNGAPTEPGEYSYTVTATGSARYVGGTVKTGSFSITNAGAIDPEPEKTYKLTVAGADVTLPEDANTSALKAGQLVSLTAYPDTATECFAQWVVSGADGALSPADLMDAADEPLTEEAFKQRTLTFRMPAQNLNITAMTTPVEQLPEEESTEFSPLQTVAIVAGTTAWFAGSAVMGYEAVTYSILADLLPKGTAIPRTREQLAVLLWSTAGKPEPAAPAVYSDVAEPDTAKAARWAVEAGLLPDKGEGVFTPGKRVTKVQVIRAWNRLKKLGLAK